MALESFGKAVAELRECGFAAARPRSGRVRIRPTRPPAHTPARCPRALCRWRRAARHPCRRCVGGCHGRQEAQAQGARPRDAQARHLGLQLLHRRPPDRPEGLRAGAPPQGGHGQAGRRVEGAGPRGPQGAHLPRPCCLASASLAAAMAHLGSDPGPARPLQVYEDRAAASKSAHDEEMVAYARDHPDYKPPKKAAVSRACTACTASGGCTADNSRGSPHLPPRRCQPLLSLSPLQAKSAAAASASAAVAAAEESEHSDDDSDGSDTEVRVWRAALLPGRVAVCTVRQHDGALHLPTPNTGSPPAPAFCRALARRTRSPRRRRAPPPPLR